ncbi:MAG TPA: hypothetical protein VKD22_11550 [Ramlibacter sp.]|nr:hypothetical protein [Ramlibacter sp.]
MGPAVPEAGAAAERALGERVHALSPAAAVVLCVFAPHAALFPDPLAAVLRRVGGALTHTEWFAITRWAAAAWSAAPPPEFAEIVAVQPRWVGLALYLATHHPAQRDVVPMVGAALRAETGAGLPPATIRALGQYAVAHHEPDRAFVVGLARRKLREIGI